MSTKLIQYVVLTRSQFDELATKDSTTLYFVSDTCELYRGSVNYSSAITYYTTGNRPASGAIGKLYINSDTGEGSTWNGTAWSVVIPQIASSVISSGTTATTLPVSGAAVKAYVESVAASTLAQCVTSISWNGTTKSIEYVVNSNTITVPISALATKLAYDGSTGKLSLKDRSETEISSVNIPLDNFITGGSYNTSTKSLVLNMQNGTSVSIPAADLVQLYHDFDTDSVDVTITTDAQGNNVISANVKVSNAANNAVEIKSDGLYIPSTATKMDKVGTGHTDEVITSDANGNAQASGFKVGASTLNANAATQQTLLATEAAVSAVKSNLEATAEATYVKLVNIITDVADIDVDNPRADKVIAESAMVEALSWIELTA